MGVVIYRKSSARETQHATGLRWRGFLLGEVNGKRGKRGDRPLGTGGEERREEERERQMETKRKREGWEVGRAL